MQMERRQERSAMTCLMKIVQTTIRPMKVTMNTSRLMKDAAKGGGAAWAAAREEDKVREKGRADGEANAVMLPNKDKVQAGVKAGEQDPARDGERDAEEVEWMAIPL